MKKRLAVLVLAFAMVLTMSASVFAAGDNSGKNNGATTYGAGEAKLVKYLQAPEGIDLTAETFTFTFTPADDTADRTNDNTYVVPKDDFTSTSATIKLNPAEGATDNEMTSTGESETQNMKGVKTIASIFANYSFPRAGEYTFTVAETPGSTDDMTYSTDTYTLKLFVKNDPTAQDPNHKTITDVTIQDDEGKKVDATDDNPTNNDDPDTPNVTEPTPSDSNGGFTFTNLLSPTVDKHDEPGNKNPDPDPQDPTNPNPINEGPNTPDNPNIVIEDQPGAFVLDKKVLGAYGDQTKEFEFTVTVTLPKTNKGFAFTGANAPTVTTNKGRIDGTWADGANVTVYLKHDGQLNFPKLPVGTKITVAEAAETNYTTVWTTSLNPDATQNILVKANGGGYAICRNSFNDEAITPTGIIINNLPYILLIGLALGGIVLFSRKRRYE